MPVTDDGKKVVIRVPCIYYPIQFQENQGQESQEQVRALLNSSSKVNAISPAYVERLGLKTWKTNVGAQKIDGSILENFEMVIADFQVEDKGSRPKFFQEIFLVADTKFEVILGMPLLKLSNANVSFNEGTLTWKSYITNKVLLTTKRVQLIDPQEFVIAALDIDSETFVVHMAIWEREEMPVHFKRQV